MYDIMFSLPVHEKIDVVIDQIINIKKYNKHSAIVLHISANLALTNKEEEQLKDFSSNLGGIFINKTRIKTGRYNIIETHLANYNCIKDVDFVYFAFVASNELFIKEGLFDYISQFDCVNYKYKHNINADSSQIEWSQMKKAIYDNQLILLIKEFNGQNIYGGQIEGSFYKKELFQKMVNKINAFFEPNSNNIDYAKEEVYFHTVCAYLNNGFISCKNYTYINWQNILKLTKKEIRFAIKCQNYFSVKRIDRNLNDYLRIFIRNKSNTYKTARRIIGRSVKRIEPIKSFLIRKMRNFKRFCKKIIKQ